ncbi:MAG: hypothetical protein EOO90_31255 [Pedobacter sp.]|nr:MAG: hypothetical protein EOO90_31255 [Pedobacter sp.]
MNNISFSGIYLEKLETSEIWACSSSIPSYLYQQTAKVQPNENALYKTERYRVNIAAANN